MVLPDSLMIFSSVGSNLAGFQIELRYPNSRGGIGFLAKPFAE